MTPDSTYEIRQLDDPNRDDLFTKPSETDSDLFRAAEWLGNLVAFVGGESEIFDGAFGEQTVTRCTIVAVLDAPDGPALFRNSLVFGKALAPQARGGDVVLGVIAKGTAKTGQNAPYVLEDPDDAQATAARSWWVKHMVKAGDSWVYGDDEAPF